MKLNVHKLSKDYFRCNKIPGQSTEFGLKKKSVLLMYKLISLKRMEGRMLILSEQEMNTVCKTRGNRNCM